MTTLVPAVCTSCTGRLDVDPALEAAVCPFCRTPYIVAKAINAYTVENTSIRHADTVIQGAHTVNVRTGSVGSLVSFVERQLELKEQKRQEEKRVQEERERRQREAAERFWGFVRRQWKLIAAGFAVLVSAIVVLSIVAAAGADAANAPDADGRLTMPSSSASFAGDHVVAVVEQLEARGFTSVRTEALGDLITGWINKPDTVERVAVGGNPDYSTSARFDPDVDIVIYYHSFPVDDEVVGEPSDDEAAPAETAAPAPGASQEIDAAQVRARFLESWGVATELDLLEIYLDDPVAPTYAITEWETNGSWVRVHLQEQLSSGEALATGRQVLGLTCDLFPQLAGIIVRGADGIDHNVSRSQAPLCTL